MDGIELKPSDMCQSIDTVSSFVFSAISPNFL